jgi:hypothetical protein
MWFSALTTVVTGRESGLIRGALVLILSGTYHSIQTVDWEPIELFPALLLALFPWQSKGDQQLYVAS